MFLAFLFVIHFPLSLRWCCPEGGLSMLRRVCSLPKEPPHRAHHLQEQGFKKSSETTFKSLEGAKINSSYSSQSYHNFHLRTRWVMHFLVQSKQNIHMATRKSLSHYCGSLIQVASTLFVMKIFKKVMCHALSGITSSPSQ